MDDDEEAVRDLEHGSQDPIFSAGFQQSDSLLDRRDRSPLMAVLKDMVERRRQQKQRRLLTPRDDDTPESQSVDTRRVVKKFSFAIPPAMVAAANQMGQRTERAENHQGETVDETAAEKERGMYLSWNLFYKARGDPHTHNTSSDAAANNKEKMLQQELQKSLSEGMGCSPEGGLPLISADESILDTITGEESILDASIGEDGETNDENVDEQHPSDETEHSETLNIVEQDEEKVDNADDEEALLPNARSSQAADDEELEEDEEQSDVKPTAGLAQKADDEESNCSDPVVEAQDETKVNKKEKETIPAARGIFGRAQTRIQRYRRMVDHDDSESPARGAPPMAEVTIDNNAPTVGASSSPERRLLSDWNDLFDNDRLAPPSGSEDGSEDGSRARRGDDMFDIDYLGPPSTSDEESEHDPYFSSSEIEETEEEGGPSTSMNGYRNDDSDGESSEQDSVERNARKVLRPQRARRRRQNSGSVTSSQSLLSYTIEEETEEELQKATHDDQDSNSSPKSQQGSIKRANSFPNLSRLSLSSPVREIVAEDVTMNGMNSYRAAEVSRHADDRSALLSVYTGMSEKESVLTGPKAFRDQKSELDLNQPDDESSSFYASPNTSPTRLLQKRRSKSLEVRSRPPFETKIWKTEVELRASIHRTQSYVSSSGSSSNEETSSRGRVRQSRVQRLQTQRNLRHQSGERKYYSDYSDDTGTTTSLSTPKISGNRKPRAVSPGDPSDEDMSSSAKSEVDIVESFLLDSVDVSLARLARGSDEEYGTEEESI
ncbi:hypothetical protein ACA910_003159 [Epithemia clementina (nom. ined.)]